MATSVLQPRHTALRLPQGRRVPRGSTRWYALTVPEGREESIARDLRKLVPADLLHDVFAIRKEYWVKRALDVGHVLRSSTALVEDGKLRIVSGPLRGMEGRLRDVGSHRRRCMVDIADADGGFSELMPLEVRK